MLRALLLLLLSLALPAADRPVVVKAARLLDVKTGRLIMPGVVVVQGGRIVAGPAPAGAEVVDLGDRTLLPGLIDTHVHLGFPAGLPEAERLKQSDARRLLVAVQTARMLLDRGFTTVRDCGGPFGLLDLRRAIDKGEYPGPRLLVSGWALSITGGHGDLNGYPADLHYDRENLVDTPDLARARVREWAKRGVDFVKIHATGGVLSNHDDPGAPSFSPAEFKVLVDEATRRGLHVAAHAHGDQGIREAVEAGVRSIEHGSLMSPATAQLMKAKGVFLVPTLYALESILLPGNPLKFTEGSLAKARAIMPLRRAGFKAALDAGVTVAYGSDIGVFRHEDVAKDFRFLVDYGMSPLQAIQAATLHAAKLLKLEGQVGTLEAGAFADLIAVPGNPLERIEALESPAFVMKGGLVARRP